MQRRARLGAASVLLVFVACSNDRNLGSFPDGGGGAGPSATGGGFGGGGGGAQGGGGGSVKPDPPNPWQQATCLVTRTECSGWVEDDVDKLDGVDVNCPPGNLVSNGGVTATVCFQNKELTPTFVQQQTEAQDACNSYCESGLFIGNYPLGSVAQTGGPITCQASVTSFANQAAGQCSTVTQPPDAGPPAATTFALCTLGGRAIDSTPGFPTGTKQAADQTNYPLSMPVVNGGENASGCFDPTMTTAELFCKHGLQWPVAPTGVATLPTPPGGPNLAIQFPYWDVAQVQPNDTATDCTNEKNSIGFAASGIARGPSLEGAR